MTKTSKPNLSTEERELISLYLLEHSRNLKPDRGRIGMAATKWGVTRRTISTIWAIAKKQRQQGQVLNVKAKIKGKKGPPKLAFNMEAIMAVPFSKRHTYQSLSFQLKVSESTIRRWILLGMLRMHTNSLKPLLTNECKLIRLKFSLNSVFVDKLLKVVKFKSMKYVIHIDEKWFYLTKDHQRLILLPQEEEPYRTCKNKAYIPKVMFMCAVGRPCYNDAGECIFDGKIGMWPFTRQVKAKKNSKNRPKDTLITEPIPSVNREVVKQCMLRNIIPAIKEKWPTHLSREIVIQQDNATPHLKDHDDDVFAAANSDGFNISIKQQPANSPDMNINDLGLFRAIQSLQVKKNAYNVDELVEAVMTSYEEMEASKLNNVFITLQSVLVEVMKIRGSNKYKIPHMNKARLAREGILPEDLEVDSTIIRDCIDYLLELGQATELETLMADLDDHPEI